ncbi:hypothetical protein L210DRAFT_3518760 [Boletus edulis BED1]|uniref:Transmembrane protein n=1 Tax=Boletus edulis BED1 TaxID=1328754 RepID=A0AAD4C8U5_BOLED|nr:hypothetical protein L210DRAFT_3518760 [Boletus edulis BED1]
MRRLLGLKDSTNTPSSHTKGKERQRDSTSASISLPNPSSSHTPMEVHVSTEVHSAPDRLGFHPLSSKASLASSSPASSDSRPLPPEIHVPTHPYPYWQGYTHTPSSSSQSSLESPMTPSHVSWLSSGVANAPGNYNAANGLTSPAIVPQSSAEPSSTSHSFIQGRSSPSPNFPPPPPTNPPPNLVTRPKLLHPTKSSHSLRVPVQEFFNQQLSPIVEQDYLSPEKRPVSLPSSSHEGAGSRSSTTRTVRTSTAMTPVSPVGDGIGTATVTPVSPVPMTPVLVGARGTPSTPQMQAQTPVTPSCPGGVVPFARLKEEEGNDSPRPSPVSTFILRPLNRSISLSSTRTHQTSASSVTPPVIPPLDLRPEFKGQGFLTTPTSLHSRGLLDVVARDDDDSVSDRRESFVTAHTGAGRESRYSLGQDEVFVDAEEGFRRDSTGTIQQFDSRLLEDDADTPSTPLPQPIPQDTLKPVKPPVTRTSDHHPHPNSYPHPHRPTPSPTLHPSRLGVTAPSLQDLGSSISTSSSFIDRRFAPSSLYLPPTSERDSAHKAGSKWALHLERVDTIQALFWLGFIAPWCWLIGGWLITAKPPPRRYPSGSGYDGYHSSLGGGGSSLPLWTNTKSVQSFDSMRMHHGYPFMAPSVLTLMPPPPPPYQSQRAAVVLTPKSVGLGRRGTRNPWVRRCRIAAVTSGVLILVAFLVALVVAATSHSIA